jgi:hypothetical protein
MLKISYTTIVNKHFEPYLEQLIKSHQMFSRIDLTVYTVNFDVNNNDYKNIKFVRFTDVNLLEFDETGHNKYIKNEYEKHKYTTLLKTKILNKFSDSYDYYFFVDSDILFTKNSDTLVLNTINEFGFSKFPISTKYFYEFSTTHNPTEHIFNENGEYNPKSLGYYPLIELYNTEFSMIHYLTTYCVYYTKECFEFLNEVEKICFDNNVIIDYKKFLPLGDETVFNYLYSKYNFNKFISGFLCYNVSPFLCIEDSLKNLKQINPFVSFIHTKRYIYESADEKKFNKLNIDEYNQLFEVLLSNDVLDSTINVTSFKKENNTETLIFDPNETYDGHYLVNIVSLFRPNEQHLYTLHLNYKNNYFLSKNDDGTWVKDLYLIVVNNDFNQKIKDCIKLT